MKTKTSKYRLLAICLITAYILSLLPTQVFAADSKSDSIEKICCTAMLEDSFTDNEVLIVMMPEYNQEVYVISDFNEVGCNALEELTYSTEPGVVGRVFLLTLNERSKQNVLDAIEILEQREDIYSAEPNAIIEPNASTTGTTYTDNINNAEQTSVLAANLEPNDPSYQGNMQWGIDRINLPAAWGICSDASSIYVGIIDSGIDGSHPDLANRVNESLSREPKFTFMVFCGCMHQIKSLLLVLNM